MSWEETALTLLGTTVVCKPVHYLWVLLQQIMQIFYSFFYLFFLRSLPKQYVHSSEPVHFVLSTEGENDTYIEIYSCRRRAGEKTCRAFTTALLITPKKKLS